MRPREEAASLSRTIDIHGYSVAMPELYSAKAHIFAERGWGLGVVAPAPDVIERCARWHVGFLDEVGTDVQLVGPRPYHLSCGREPAALVRLWTDLYNATIAAQCALYPDRLRPLGALPQSVDASPAQWVAGLAEEAERHGWVGVVVNPDPGEGDGSTPALGDRYWYPVWEALERADMPALIIAGATRSRREGYVGHYITESDIATLSLLESEHVFADFPALKLIMSYGGGSTPYQIDRWRARRLRQPGREDLAVTLRRLYFDTVVHAPASLSLLLSVCGPDRCLFGSQRPGAASVVDPDTGQAMDDLKPKIESLAWLSGEDRNAVFEGNALKVFRRLDRSASSTPATPSSLNAPIPFPAKAG